MEYSSGKADKAAGTKKTKNKSKQQQDYLQGEIGLYLKNWKVVLFLPKKKDYIQDGEIGLFYGRNRTALNIVIIKQS